MTLQVALPIVCVFIRHWDTTAKEFEKKLLPRLAVEGYDTLCYEQPQDMTADELIAGLDERLQEDTALHAQVRHRLTELRMNYDEKLSDIPMSKLTALMQKVSSDRYSALADRMKTYSAHLVQKEIYQVANKQSFLIEGIDIASIYFRLMMEGDPNERMQKLDENETIRIQTFIDNLLRLYQRREGVIFFCGALHHGNLMAKLKEKNMQDNVVCYFPHSSNRFDDSFDDLKMYPSLNDCSYRLSNVDDIEKLIDKVVKEVKLKNTHYHPENISLNSHSALLSKIFKANFQAFKRAGHYVDALLAVEQAPHLENVVQTLQENKISTRYVILHEQKYLVIPEVNTREVAEMIRILAKFKRLISLKTIQM